MGIAPMYRVTQTGSGVAGSPFYLTGYFDSTAGTALQAATSWRNIVAPPVSYFGTPYTYDPITLVDTVDPVTGNITGITPVAIAARTFTSVGEKLPTFVNMGLNWRTGIYRNGREVRGRTNIAGFTEDANGPTGDPVALYVTDFQTRINTEVANPVASLVVWSKKNGEWFEVSTGTVANKWYVLKSRRS